MPVSDTQENGAAGCYNGPLQNEWGDFVDKSIKAAVELFPKIFVQGGQGNWKAVHPDFPDVDHDEDQLKGVITVFDWFSVFMQSDIIVRDQATRDENKAMEIYDLTSGLINIVKKRNGTYEK